MKPNPEGSATERAAEDAFSDYLRLVDEGREVDFEGFCSERPHLASALRSLRDDWERMAGLVDDLGSGFDDDGPPATEASLDPALLESYAPDRGSGLIEPGQPGAPPASATADGAPAAPGAAPAAQGNGNGNGHGAGNGNGHGGNGHGHAAGDVSGTFELDVEGRGPVPAGVDGRASVKEVISRLSAGAGNRRYAPRGEIARGGMGVVLRMWDADLRRNLAMKVMLDRNKRKQQDSASQSRQIGRFLEEAQITGQLDHPGIVPVHELGLNDKGQLYFTMRLVRGRSLRTIFELVHDEKESWTTARALSVIQRVCEAMAYAHSKRVIHRDIKPANIMVGRFGEVYVMDWGLAKVTGRRDIHDLRLKERQQEHEEGDPGEVFPEDEASDSPLLTMDGTVVGTPSYMAPEQAAGNSELVGPHSDIYSVGALLYHLLTGRMPYVSPDERVSPFDVLERVREGPPPRIHTLDDKVPPELVAICEKAMARDISIRYPSMEAMADDLRAFLEGRVVRTYEAGALAEARKWVVRNKSSALVLGVALAALMYLFIDLVLTNDELSLKTKALEDARQLEQDAKDKVAAANTELEQSNEDLRDETQAAETAREDAERNGYVANMAATDASLRFHELVEAKIRLEGSPASLRNWEWHHLELRSDPSLHTFDDHTGRVTQVVFSPDAMFLASSSWDGSTRVWDVRDRVLVSLLDPGEGGISALAFHPNNRTLATGNQSGEVILWNAETGERLHTLLQNPQDPAENGEVTSLAFSPNGKQLFAGTVKQRIYVWNVDNAKRDSFPVIHRNRITSVALSPNGRYLVSGSNDSTAGLWDARTGRFEQSLVHEHPVYAVAFNPSPDVPIVATGCADSVVRLWSAEDGSLLRSLVGHTESVDSVAFSHDGELLLSGSADGTLRLWEVYTGELRAVLDGHEQAVSSVAVGPDGMFLASGSHDGTVKLWDRAWDGASTLLEGHTAPVTSLAASSDGLRLVSAGDDSRLFLWNTDRLQALCAADLRLEGSAVVAVRPDGLQVAAGLHADRLGVPNPISLWSAPDGDDELVRLPLELEGHAGRVLSVAYDPSGTRLASGGDDGVLRVWDLATGEVLQEMSGQFNDVRSLAWDPTGERLAFGDGLGVLHVWNLTTGDERKLFEPGRDETVGAVLWAPNGLLVSTLGRDILVRDERYEVTAELRGHQDAVNALAIHPDGSRLASGSQDGTLRVWDPIYGAHMLTLRVDAPVDAVAFSPDGSRLYATQDNDVRVYETNSPLVTYRERRARIEVADQAEEAYTQLLKRYVTPERVIQNVTADGPIDPVLESEIVRLARNHGADAERLANAAWTSLRDRHAGQLAHVEARGLALAANNILTGDAQVLGYLGAAHYRNGDYKSAKSALEQAANLARAKGEEPPAWNLLFLAMAYHRLKDVTTADEIFRHALKAGEAGTDQITRMLELEAQEVLDGEP